MLQGYRDGVEVSGIRLEKVKPCVCAISIASTANDWVLGPSRRNAWSMQLIVSA